MTELHISLEPQLQELLQPLVDVHPLDLSAKTVHYSTLRGIAKWARSDDGVAFLRANGLEPSSYSMISLLAGSKTSPEGKFGPYTPPAEPEQLEADRRQERKAITSIINGVLSVLGAGAAAYYGSERAGWRNEWCRQRVLFALLVAAVVAIAEAVLYIIWQSRRSKSKPIRRTRYALHKKSDGDPTSDDIGALLAQETATEEVDGNKLPALRQRVRKESD